MEDRVEGGKKGAVTRERPKEKHSKVSDLISRFEENRYELTFLSGSKDELSAHVTEVPV